MVTKLIQGVAGGGPLSTPSFDGSDRNRHGAASRMPFSFFCWKGGRTPPGSKTACTRPQRRRGGAGFVSGSVICRGTRSPHTFIIHPSEGSGVTGRDRDTPTMTDEVKYEVNEEQADEFAVQFWAEVGRRSASDAVYPTTVRKPDELDWDEVDAEDFREADHEHAATIADGAFKVINGIAGGNVSSAVSRRVRDGFEDAEACVFVVPEWFAKDEWGAWESVWLARFKGDTRKGGAWKMEDLIPRSDWGEDEYFLNPIEFSTVPKSLASVFTATRKSQSTGLVIERGLDSSVVEAHEADPREETVVFTGIKRDRYGEKLVIDFEPPWGNEAEHEAVKSTLNAFPWEDAHCTFDGDDWVMDPGYLPTAVDALTHDGHSVGITESVRQFCRKSLTDSRQVVFAEMTGVSL